MYQWERRLRLYSGLVLAVYVILHFANHALGIISFGAMEAMRSVLSPIYDNPLMVILLHGSLLTHFSLALMRLYRRRTFKMPRWEWLQIILGLSIAPLIVAHVIGTRVSAEIGDFDPDYYYLASLIAAKPRLMVQMPFLMTIVWIYLAMGLHFWLRIQRWYRRTFPLWVFLAIA
ncbi:MAG: hypothetical protein DHS20C01_11830 [marine bacterium B5-7]|nr:MAG: hypothetical protein DHS20C01_11830 [marine bacterium B5-7]